MHFVRNHDIDWFWKIAIQKTYDRQINNMFIFQLYYWKISPKNFARQFSFYIAQFSVKDNLADNQDCQVESRPFCKKILSLSSVKWIIVFTVIKWNVKGVSPKNRLWSQWFSMTQLLSHTIAHFTLAGTDLLCMLNWGTQWTMVSYLKK